MLLDFFPASAGRRSSAFASGEQFEAELVFYPALLPLRAVLAERMPLDAIRAWPGGAPADPLQSFLAAEDAAPGTISVPVMPPPGHLAEAAGGGPVWWRSADSAHCLPVANAPPPQSRGMALEAAAAIWDGARLTLLAAQSNWGRLAFDA
jgi:hypothetical protein